ncbi:MAG: hypothetical protein J7527_18380, partial [Chitinophagaceae bacterium]|nr:hypothetical protein [Chitinophagaceae bacterium]
MKKGTCSTTLLHFIYSKKIVSLMQKILRRESGRSSAPQLVWGVSVDQDGSILNIEQISQNGLD